MTNETAIARITAKFSTIRRNKDGSIAGPAVNGCRKILKNTFKANGMEHNAACRAAGDIVRELEKAVAR